MSWFSAPTLPPRWERRRRTLHIIDVENLVGDEHRRADRHVFSHALGTYAAATGMRSDDPVLLGCHPGLVFAAQEALGSRGKIYTGRGRDGADLALLEAAPASFVTSRYHLVTIGSGDHIFAPLAAELAEAGVLVTVAATAGCLSRELAAHATRTIELDLVVSHKAS